MRGVAESYGWPPAVLIHMSIAELLFWRGHDGGEITHEQAMRIWQRQQRMRAAQPQE
jgi:hypothetical protein